MIYEILYLLLLGFGGKYLLSLVNNWSKINENVAKWINYIGIGLFCIAVIKFIYKLITGKYQFVLLISNYDKNNAIYQVLCDFKQKSKQLIKKLKRYFICFMIPLIVPSIYLLGFKLFLNKENTFIIKCYVIYIGVVVWFLLFIYKDEKLRLIQFESILNGYLNKYSELLTNNGGNITNEMKQLENKAYQLEKNMRKIELAKTGGEISGAAAYVAGSYIGSKVGDAIVKNNKGITDDTIIKDEKKVTRSKVDSYVEIMHEKLRKH